TAYRQQIVQDLVPTLLDDLEETVRTRIDAYVAQMPLVRVPAAPSTPKPSVKVVPQVESVPEVVQQPVVAPAPAIAKPVVSPAEPVVAEPEPVVVEVVEPEPVPVEPEPVIKEGQEVITLPDFEEEQQVVFLDPDEYEAQRQEIRKQAIDEVLRRIAP
ncbi:MAG: hypothetical protein GX315_03015, partial [Spirochaetales bacterium]|nr:hypothetical protein [Spirochaetales bacterium]